jgi:hypothetical protein
MPLLDHFHPPLSNTRHWESFHARWAAAIADALNEDLLPPGYFAEEQVHVGSRVEIDVATFDRAASTASGAATGGGTATLSKRAWSPAAPPLEMPAVFPDSVEVLVYSGEAGPTLVAAVELISPGNKDRAESRRAFAAKCAGYLQQGIGLVVVDTVTNRQGNLHNELVRLTGAGDEFLIAPDPLYAVAYRPARREESDRIQLWPAALAVGGALPVMPLALDKGVFVPLDLEASYTDARERRRLP